MRQMQRLGYIAGAFLAWGCGSDQITNASGDASTGAEPPMPERPLSRCGPGAYKPQVVLAIPAPGFGKHMLGRALDHRFEMLTNPGPTSLFFDSSPVRVPVNVTNHRLFDIDDNATFDAHVDAWRLEHSDGTVDTTLTEQDKTNAEELGASTTEEPVVGEHVVTEERMNNETEAKRSSATDAGLKFRFGTFNDKRYLAYQVMRTTEVATLDSTKLMREPPDDARWYAAAIHSGHSYEALFSGSRENFDLGLKIRLKRAFEDPEGQDHSDLGLDSGLVQLRKRHELEVTTFQRGLVPKNGFATFARSEDDIHDNYESLSETSTSKPVLVEYHSIEKCD